MPPVERITRRSSSALLAVGAAAAAVKLTSARTTVTCVISILRMFTASAPFLRAAASSINLRAGLFHDLRPLRSVGFLERGELFRRAADHLGAEARHALAHVGEPHDLH